MNKIKIAKGIITSKIFRKPFYVKLYVTRKCNLRCKMCNVWKNKDTKEMNIEEIRVAAKKIKKLRTSHVVITGGEPLLRKDIYEIVSIFSKLGISTRLQTNGLLLTEQKLDKLIKSGLDDITISLDTLDNKKQDAICGVRGMNISNKAVKMLKLAVKKMPKSITVANIVISHKNLDELIDLIKIFDSIGAWPTFCPVSLSEDKENQLFKAKADEFAFTKQDRIIAEKVYKEILKLKKRGYKISLSSKYIKQSLNYIKTGNKRWRCDAGELYFVVLPQGQFSFCDDISTKYNILDKNFIESYQSKDFKNFLKSAQNKCEGCIYGIFRETSSLINSPQVLINRFLTLIRVKRKELFSKQ